MQFLFNRFKVRIELNYHNRVTFVTGKLFSKQLLQLMTTDKLSTVFIVVFNSIQIT